MFAPTVALLIVATISAAAASLGDRLNFFQDCLFECTQFRCHDPRQLAHFHQESGLIKLLLGWSCEEECKYECKWDAISWLLSEEVGISAAEVPQFHGKVAMRDAYCLPNQCTNCFFVPSS